jgi:shikimate dehydrogenase
LRPSADTIEDILKPFVPDLRGRARGHTLIGLVGRAIQASRTPRMHERESARLGLSCNYVLVDFDQMGLPDAALGRVISAVRATGFAGVNVTHPFKQAVMPLLDAMAPEAEAIGAVNTVVFSGSRTIGHNTDCWGFTESFRDAMHGAPLGRIVQFGAGGAGAAVAYALMELGVRELLIVDSEAGRAARLAVGMASRFPGRVRAQTDIAAALPGANGIINTTPVGMAKYPGMPFDANLLSPHHWVADIIYFPEETELLRTSRALGCRTLAGAGMAIYQAVRAFELFTGRMPDRRAMAEHFEAAA